MLIHNQRPDRGSRPVRSPQRTSAVVLSCGALISTNRLLAWSALPRRRGLLMAAVAAHAALQQQQTQPVSASRDMRATHNTRHLHKHRDCSRQQQAGPAAVTLHEHQRSEGANASTLKYWRLPCLTCQAPWQCRVRSSCCHQTWTCAGHQGLTAQSPAQGGGNTHLVMFGGAYRSTINWQASGWCSACGSRLCGQLVGTSRQRAAPRWRLTDEASLPPPWAVLCCAARLLALRACARVLTVTQSESPWMPAISSWSVIPYTSLLFRGRLEPVQHTKRRREHQSEEQWWTHHTISPWLSVAGSGSL